MRTTLPPAHKVIGPAGLMVGVEGKAITLIVALADEADWQPLAFTACTK